MQFLLIAHDGDDDEALNRRLQAREQHIAGGSPSATTFGCRSGVSPHRNRKAPGTRHIGAQAASVTATAVERTSRSTVTIASTSASENRSSGPPLARAVKGAS